MADNYVGQPPNAVNVLGDFSPIGAINFFHGVPDASWLRLNGQTVSKLLYPDLWAWAQSFITTDQTANPGLYLSVDASNFKVPKLDGLFIRAQGTYDAERVSAAVGVLQGDSLQEHGHQAANNDAGALAGGGGFMQFGTTRGGILKDLAKTTIPRTANETRGANVALVACVKALKAVIVPTTPMPLSDMKLLDVKDAANVASLDFTTGFTSEYDSFQFVLRGVIPSANDASMNMRCSNDGGATFSSATTDYYETFNIIQQGTNYPTTRSNAGFAAVGQACTNGVTENGVNGLVNLFQPSLVGRSKHFTVHSECYRSATGQVVFHSGGMFYQAPTYPAINGIRFFFNSGNIALGRILMYGLRNTVQSLAMPPNSSAAQQADQEAATSTDKFVTPATQKWSPSASKAWVKFRISGAVIVASYNIASVVRAAAGIFDITFATPFSSADYTINVTPQSDTQMTGQALVTVPPTASGCRIITHAAGASADPTSFSAVFSGDQ